MKPAGFHNHLFPTLRGYQRDWFSADLSAGLIVAILIVPQAIAYAFLAGLPAEMGLYAALLPLFMYALLGTSPTLAVGPVAIVSLMTLEALSPLATSDIPASAYASTLALLVAGFMLLFYLIGLGRWTSFISHTVISAFTSAAAIVIVMNQVKHLTGLSIPREGLFFQPLLSAAEQLQNINWPALWLGAAILIMLILWPKLTSGKLSKAGPLLAVIMGLVVYATSGVDIKTVGHIPSGLPSLEIPAVLAEHWRTLAWDKLLPSASVIALIAYLESLSVGTAMALQTRHRLDANQELLALSGANLVASLSQAYPVAGGFGRSMVNMAAGAKTQLAALITLLLVALVCLFFSSWFTTLPNTVLGAIIIAAVIPLIKWQDGLHAWHYHKSDGLIWLVTFSAVLATNAETGILIGISLSLLMYLKRTSQPHIAEVGRYQDSDHFRNVDRHDVTTCPELLLIRVDENLYFANSQYLEDYIQQRLQSKPKTKHIILIGSAINHIDFNGYETLLRLLLQLEETGIQLHLAEFKGPVMDQLASSELLMKLNAGKVFFTASDALRELCGK